jgi:hypothetical protein
MILAARVFVAGLYVALKSVMIAMMASCLVGDTTMVIYPQIMGN